MVHPQSTCSGDERTVDCHHPLTCSILKVSFKNLLKGPYASKIEKGTYGHEIPLVWTRRFPWRTLQKQMTLEVFGESENESVTFIDVKD